MGKNLEKTIRSSCATRPNPSSSDRRTTAVPALGDPARATPWQIIVATTARSAPTPIQLVPMSRPAPPVLTVRYDGSERTFAAGNDLVIGRDLRADIRVAHPLISRAHLLVRFDQGRWIAIDNGSLNGLYVNNRRVPVVDIQDGQRVNIGNPDGPALTFEVGRHQGSVGRPPLTTSIPLTSASGVHATPPHVDPSRPGQPQQSVPATRMPPAYPPSSPQPA